MNGINIGSSLLEPLEKTDYIIDLLQRGTLVNVPTFANWTQTVTGSGGGGTGLGSVGATSGTTTGSTSMQSMIVYMLDSGSGTEARINWSKALRLWFRFIRTTPDAGTNTTGYVQLKEASTIGQLAAKGIGIVIDGASGFVVSGESYGTQRNTTALSTTLTTAVSVGCEIRHYPASRIEWWINGVLKGTESTAANIPTGAAGAASRIVMSIGNGAGTSNVVLDLGYTWIWQAL